MRLCICVYYYRRSPDGKNPLEQAGALLEGRLEHLVRDGERPKDVGSIGMPVYGAESTTIVTLGNLCLRVSSALRRYQPVIGLPYRLPLNPRFSRNGSLACYLGGTACGAQTYSLSFLEVVLAGTMPISISISILLQYSTRDVCIHPRPEYVVKGEL
jgi:hypothetical protein